MQRGADFCSLCNLTDKPVINGCKNLRLSAFFPVTSGNGLFRTMSEAGSFSERYKPVALFLQGTDGFVQIAVVEFVGTSVVRSQMNE